MSISFVIAMHVASSRVRVCLIVLVCLAVGRLCALAPEAPSKQRGKYENIIEPVWIFPGASWSIETSNGIMTFQGLRNDYGEKITLPYSSLLYSSCMLYVNIEGFFDTRTKVVLGFIDKPFNMSWLQSPSFLQDANAAEIDFKIMSDIVDMVSSIRPFAGYNYQDLLLKDDRDSQVSAYYGYHSILFGVDWTAFPTSFLRTNCYAGVAPIMISGTITVDPYIIYGASLMATFWRFKVGLSYSGKRSPNKFSRNNDYAFKVEELGVSIWMKL